MEVTNNSNVVNQPVNQEWSPLTWALVSAVVVVVLRNIGFKKEVDDVIEEITE